MTILKMYKINAHHIIKCSMLLFTMGKVAFWEFYVELWQGLWGVPFDFHVLLYISRGAAFISSHKWACKPPLRTHPLYWQASHFCLSSTATCPADTCLSPCWDSDDTSESVQMRHRRYAPWQHWVYRGVTSLKLRLHWWDRCDWHLSRDSVSPAEAE